MEPNLFEAVDAYIEQLFVADSKPAILENCEREGIPNWAVSANQGTLLQVLALTCRATRILEIGTQGGYSTAWLAGALPENGKVITIEIDEHTANVARTNLSNAGVGHKTEVICGNALDVLQQMITSGTVPFDMVFIDADKPPYKEYFEFALKLSRPGTLIIADNVVRGGKVLDEDSDDPAVIGVRRFNETLAANKRVRATIMQNVGTKSHDGMAIAVVL